MKAKLTQIKQVGIHPGKFIIREVKQIFFFLMI